MTTAEIALPSPTIIDIVPAVELNLDNRSEPYYSRTEIGFFIHSTTKFDRITVLHMGFRSWSKGKRWIKRRGDRYTSGAPLEPNGGAHIAVPPFGIVLENVGDGFLKVNVRMPYGVERCKVTILQEGELPRKPKEVDDFIKIEDIWYCTATIGCLQTIRIEEIAQEENI